MPTANNLGLVEDSKIQFPTKLTTGMVLEVSKLPEFRSPTDDFAYESVVLTTGDGDFYTTSKVIIGSLKSVNPKSTGAVLRKAIELNNTLTVYINDFYNADTGRTGMSIGLFKQIQ